MIEYKSKQETDLYNWMPQFSWAPIFNITSKNIEQFDFYFFDYKINDTVYTELTPKFKQEFEQELFWTRLKEQQ